MSLYLPDWADLIYSREHGKGIIPLYKIIGQDAIKFVFKNPDYCCMVSQLVGEYLEEKEIMQKAQEVANKK